MFDYVWGIGTGAMMITLTSMLDDYLPNGLWYHVSAVLELT